MPISEEIYSYLPDPLDEIAEEMTELEFIVEGPLFIPIPPIPLLMVILAFAFIPAVFPTPKFFNMRGFENVIIEYRYMKIILYSSILIIIVIIPLWIYLWIRPDSIISFEILLNTIWTILIIPLFIIVKLGLEHGRRQFKFYYAKGCFKIVSKETANRIEKARYLLMGLNWYNKFLKRNIGLQINDITGIYSTVITDSPLNSNKILLSLSESFDSEDEFEPLRCLSVLFPDTKKGRILTKESIRTRIQESSDLLIPIITVTITIIATFFLPKPPD